MKFRLTFQTAIKGLSTHKSRSALTMLGIVIGIAAIIAIMSLGRGAEDLILDQVRGLGSRTIVVEAGREPSGPSDLLEIFTDSLKEKDVALLSNPDITPGVAEVAGNVGRAVNVSYGNESIRTTMLGTSELILSVFDMYPEEGEFFGEEEIRAKASVAALGSKVKEELFGNENAIGERIKIKDRSFRVVAVFGPAGQMGIFNADDLVVVPHTTAREYIIGAKHFNSILIRAETEELVPLAAEAITRTLRESHGITDPDKDDFHVTTQADAVDRVKIITSILSVLLVSVAAISLVVGGIGIMNIMLVSVTERTKEIGLRKALGATERDITVQFLLESVILTSAGGIVGIAFGSLVSFLIALALGTVVGLSWEYSFPFGAALLGFSLSAAVGLVFGIYPARIASLKSPIEALRYE